MRKTKREMASIAEERHGPIEKARIYHWNTLKYQVNGGTYYQLHSTDIVMFKNGVLTLNTGGWKTITTKERINRILHYEFDLGWQSVQSKRGVWYFQDVPFYDGMQIKLDQNGRVRHIKNSDKGIREAKRTKRLTKMINDYCQGLRKKLERDGPLYPDTGDCFFCSMHTEDGSALGDVMKDTDHLMDHLKEKYYMGSLNYNALKDQGSPCPKLHIEMNLTTNIVCAVRRYFKVRLAIPR